MIDRLHQHQVLFHQPVQQGGWVSSVTWTLQAGLLLNLGLSLHHTLL